MIDSSADRTLGDLLYTDLPVQALSGERLHLLRTVLRHKQAGPDVTMCTEGLKARGMDVEVSLDAGLFLCNLIYFSCLLRCHREGSGRWHSLFVHVPPFTTCARDQQLNLLVTLLNLLAIMYSGPAAQPQLEHLTAPHLQPQQQQQHPAGSAAGTQGLSSAPASAALLFASAAPPSQAPARLYPPASALGPSL